MRQPKDRATLQICVGLALLLVYALPTYFPPPAVAYDPATASTPALTRVFPNVPGWWVAGRLIALLMGAIFIAAANRAPPLRMPMGPAAEPVWRHRFVPHAALAAALLHLACLPFVTQLPYWMKTLYVLWMFVPAAILACGVERRGSSSTWPAPRRHALAWFSACLVLCWFALRVIVSHHSPISVDGPDWFRTFGGLARLAATGGDFMSGSMGVSEGEGDVEIRGVNALMLFFSGLPLLTLTATAPCAWWMQIFSALWLSATALVAITLARHLIGRLAMPVAAAAFLFSPYALMAQIITIPNAGTFFGALAALLPLKFLQTRSPIVLVLLAAVTGVTATLPNFVSLTALVLVLVSWVLWRQRSVAPIFIVTAAVSFVAVITPNIPKPQAVRDAYNWYVHKHWPMAVAERALAGQISPTIADWTAVDPPGTPLLALSTLLSPFAIPRQPLKLWGDTLYEPLSAGLGAVGLAICFLQAWNGNRAALALLVCLLSALLTGFVSSYDRPSLTRVSGAKLPLSLLSAVGLVAVLRSLPNLAQRRSLAMATALVVSVSGVLIFDVINRKVLPSSTYGLFMRVVSEPLLDQSAFLTAGPGSLNLPDPWDPAALPSDLQHQEADWIMTYHPYVEDLLRCAPARPVSLIDARKLDRTAGKQLLFWNPALDETIQITQRDVCRRWPHATLYTIFDQTGLTKLNAAQIAGPPWRPRTPAQKWSTRRCAAIPPTGNGSTALNGSLRRHQLGPLY